MSNKEFIKHYELLKSTGFLKYINKIECSGFVKEDSRDISLDGQGVVISWDIKEDTNFIVCLGLDSDKDIEVWVQEIDNPFNIEEKKLLDKDNVLKVIKDLFKQVKEFKQ